MNGFDLLRRLRTQSDRPVIMLTARGQEIDRVVGLELGADDYLSKPFSARELVARVHAVLRRSGHEQSATLLIVGDVLMDVAARTVRRGGTVVDLTSQEFDVLRTLLAAAGEVVSRDELFRDVLHREYSAFDRSIDNHVSSLRKKLGSHVGDVERIKAVRNAGYQYARTPRQPRG
jgi:two-component system response regulator CpxR